MCACSSTGRFARRRQPDDFTERLSAAARLLDAMRERMTPGDRVITGAVVQVPVSQGDTVVADFGPLGRVRLAIVRE
jgi:2-keto-4-pentenoate hydratase